MCSFRLIYRYRASCLFYHALNLRNTMSAHIRRKVWFDHTKRSQHHSGCLRVICHQQTCRPFSDNESDESPVLPEDVEELDSVRVHLYPDSDDPVLKAFGRVSSADGVFAVLGDSVEPRHLCQAVATLWDVQKVQERTALPPSSDFRRLIAALLERANACDDLGLVCALYCLGRLDAPGSAAAVSQLTALCVRRLPGLSLPALGRLGVCLHRWPLWPPPLTQSYLRALAGHAAACDSWDQLRQLASAFTCARRYLSVESERRFVALVHEFVLHRDTGPQDADALLKLLKVLNRRGLRRWLAPMYRDLLSLYVRTEPRPSPAVTARLGQAMVTYREAAPAVERLVAERAAALVDPDRARTRDDIWLVYTAAPHRILPGWLQQNLVDTARSHLAYLKDNLSVVGVLNEDGSRLSFVHELFFVQRLLNDLRPLRVPEHQALWDVCLQALAQEKSSGRLTRLVAYMYLSQALEREPAARSVPLEDALCRRLLDQLRGHRVLNTYRIVHLSAFVVAFCERRVPADLLSRLLLLAERDQLTTSRIRRLSRAIRIGRSRIQHMRESLPPEYVHQLTQLTIALNSATLRRLPTLTSVGSTVWLAQSAVERRGVMRGNVAVLDAVVAHFDRLTSTPELCEDQLTSQAVEMLAGCLNSIQYRHTASLEHLCRHIVRHREHVTGVVAERVLTTAFVMGYWPSDSAEFEDFLSACADIISRSLYRMSAESVLRACQALCLYGRLPAHLARAVLGQAFLEKTERQIQDSTLAESPGPSEADRRSHSGRGHRLRRLQLEVNRAIRLNLPDQDVPWFTDAYARGLPDLQTDAEHRQMLADVHETLARLAGGAHLVQSAVRTAGYQFTADLVLHRRRDGTFADRDGPMITSIAVLVPSSRDYCINTPQLSGPQLLRKRHLEILGFTVRLVHPHHWNSMALADPADKLSFLSALIDGKNLLEDLP